MKLRKSSEAQTQTSSLIPRMNATPQKVRSYDLMIEFLLLVSLQDSTLFQLVMITTPQLISNRILFIYIYNYKKISVTLTNSLVYSILLSNLIQSAPKLRCNVKPSFLGEKLRLNDFMPLI